MSTPTIRKLAPDEGRIYRDLRLAALADSPDAFGSSLAGEQGRSDAEWSARLAPSDGDLPLVAEVDGRPVGLAWGRIEQTEADTARVYQMWVAPEHRRSGAARLMLDAIVDWARDKKLRRVELFVARDNTPATELYLAAGFKPIGEPGALCGGSALLAQTMERVLEPLPPAPETLSSGEVTLRFVRIMPGDPSRGFVPGYHFRIVTPDGSDAGHINFRVGDTEHVRLAAGHIGFEVHELFRGHGYALAACRALAPFVRSVSGSVTVTCDPDNAASRRTIERLGATFVDEVDVPPGDPHYERGSRRKLRYRWTP